MPTQQDPGKQQELTTNDHDSRGWYRLVYKNDYQDVLSTEECVIEALKHFPETQQASTDDADMKQD